ncbi:MAG: hypothetical protein RL513_1856 [Pseudomonadota bacterium]|jgi:MSHA biogenesis protein MshN
MSPRLHPGGLRAVALAAAALALLGAATVRAADKPPVPRAQANKQLSPAQRLAHRVHGALEQARQGQVEAAIAGLRDIVQDHPAHHDSRLLLANLLAGRGAGPQAQAVLLEGLALEPGHANLRMQLARLQVQAGQHVAALETLEAGPAAAYPADYRAFHAVLLQAGGQHDRAVTQYAAALKEQPHRAQWLVGIAVSLRALGMTQPAREALERARLAPDFNRQLADVVAQYGVMP